MNRRAFLLGGVILGARVATARAQQSAKVRHFTGGREDQYAAACSTRPSRSGD